MQASRLIRLEGEVAAATAGQQRLDRALGDALMELGKEVAGLAENLTRELGAIRVSTAKQLRCVHAKISAMASEVSNGNGAPRRRRR